MKKKHLISRRFRLSLWLMLCALPLYASAELNNWTYRQEKDRLTNLSYSLARSPIPQRGMYDNIRLEILCKQNELQFVVDGNALITSQNRPFDMDYQIDQRAPVAVNMKTFNDSKQRGYAEGNVKSIVDDILSGQTVFVRINTMIRKLLTASISLDGAEGPVGQVLKDCGPAIAGGADGVVDYTFEQFQQDFKQLPLARQQQLLPKLRILLHEAE